MVSGSPDDPKNINKDYTKQRLILVPYNDSTSPYKVATTQPPPSENARTDIEKS